MSHLRPSARPDCVSRGPVLVALLAGTLPGRRPAGRHPGRAGRSRSSKGGLRAAGEPGPDRPVLGRRSRHRGSHGGLAHRGRSNGKGLGTTTLFVWDNSGQVRVYSVEVTADAPGLERFLKLAHAGRGHPGLRQRQLRHALGQREGPQHAWPGRSQIAQGTGATRSSTTWSRRRPSRCCSRSGSRRSTGPCSRTGRPRFESSTRRSISSDGNWSGVTIRPQGANNIAFLLDSGNAEIQALVAGGDLQRATCGRWPSRTC